MAIIEISHRRWEFCFALCAMSIAVITIIAAGIAVTVMIVAAVAVAIMTVAVTVVTAVDTAVDTAVAIGRDEMSLGSLAARFVNPLGDA